MEDLDDCNTVILDWPDCSAHSGILPAHLLVGSRSTTPLADCAGGSIGKYSSFRHCVEPVLRTTARTARLSQCASRISHFFCHTDRSGRAHTMGRSFHHPTKKRKKGGDRDRKIRARRAHLGPVPHDHDSCRGSEHTPRDWTHTLDHQSPLSLIALFAGAHHATGFIFLYTITNCHFNQTMCITKLIIIPNNYFYQISPHNIRKTQIHNCRSRISNKIG